MIHGIFDPARLACLGPKERRLYTETFGADFERVGWLNEIMSQLWPSINAAISHQFREMLGPLLRENKPSWIASLKLFRLLLDLAPHYHYL